MFIKITINDMSTPTGTIDLLQSDIEIREFIFNQAKNVLNLRGATQIETPVIELFSTVENLYGEEFNKLVYNLNDEGQKLILRYDLTVPLARFVGNNGLIKFKRFQYGKVYRRDNPQIQKGRFREFYQFDYDIIGDDQESYSNDFEMLETLNEILENIIGSNTFIVKINHKNIVINILKLIGVEENLFPLVFSALDKLDKKSFNEIKVELQQKGLSDKTINSLENIYLEITKTECDFLELLEKLKSFGINDEKTFENLSKIDIFIKKLNLSHFKFDPFLIRGMDYYTGILYEVVYKDTSIISTTIAAGGRYDNMIGKFSTRGNIPAIGMSLGVERLVKILEQTKFKQNSSEKVPQIFVATVGKNMVVDRIVLCNYLRKMGYFTISSDLAEPDMRQQFSIVFEKYSKIIPVMIIIGGKEIESNLLTIKDVNKKNQFTIPRDFDKIKQLIDSILNDNQ